MVVFGHSLLYSGKVVLFVQSGCIRPKVVVFGQKLVLFGKKLLHWNKVVTCGQKWLCFGKSECIR